MLFRTLLTASALALASAAFAQAPASFQSHQLNADGTVTLRYNAPGATKVDLTLDTLPAPLAMSKDATGIWAVTTPALPPELYNYSFSVDGVHVPDPKNIEIHSAYGMMESILDVPGPTPMPWALTDVPHGELTLHHFTTHVAKNLPANQSSYVVYTPPNFDAKKKGGYPVLYLLHGYIDDHSAWTIVGRAHFVLDNLIAAGKCVPMIVVMPLGYGNWNFLTGGYQQWQDPANVMDNVNLFEQSLETEVMPAVDREYPISKGRNAHAISGLSMGGLETLAIGLDHPEQFAWVAGMSSAIQGDTLPKRFASIDARKADFKLLWVGVGVSDHLLQPNRDFVAWAKSKGFNVTAVETPGYHQWPVWREDLVALLPQLFR